MGRKKQSPEIPQEKPASVELSDSSYDFYANDNSPLTTWTGYAAPDWAAGAKTLYAMAVWACGMRETRQGSNSGRAPRRARPAALIGAVKCSPGYMASMPAVAAGGQHGRQNTQTKHQKAI